MEEPPRYSVDCEPQDTDIEINETNNSASLDSKSLDGETNEELNNLTVPSHPRTRCPKRRNPDFLWT
jgi:hypothetical protein